MKIYIVYCFRDYDEPQALALTKESAEELMNIYKRSDPNSKHVYWIAEKTLKDKAIEI